MTTYIVIADETYLTDSDEDVATARAALRAADIKAADVFVGEPDGLGDSYRNGQKLFAEPA